MGTTQPDLSTTAAGIADLDALVTSSRQNGTVAKRHLYVALGINMQGQKELLGLWGQATEAQRLG